MSFALIHTYVHTYVLWNDPIGHWLTCAYIQHLQLHCSKYVHIFVKKLVLVFLCNNEPFGQEDYSLALTISARVARFF
jgi:hypothetical protein